MPVSKIMLYTGLAILLLCVATVALFFAIAFILSWAYSLFGVIGVISVMVVFWLVAYFCRF